MTEAGLAIRIIWHDADVYEIEVRAGNGRFAGTACIYIGLDHLGQFASELAAFPSGVPDERAFEFGARKEGCVRGFCGFRFYTADQVGHAAVAITIEDNRPPHDTATLTLPVEAANLDRFVQKLRTMEAKRSGVATLGDL